jgi:TM2 domain-containing membrane protein YozV
MNTQNNPNKDRLVASYILCAAGFLGIGGLHRLYNGKIATGLLWLCTGGLLYVGQLVDLLLIPGMVDEYEQNLRIKAGLSPLGLPVNQSVVNAQVYRPTGNQLMVQLLEAAESKGGYLTVTQGVKATGASFEEVEKVLKEMLKSGYVRIDNDPVTGAVTYHFHEM